MPGRPLLKLLDSGHILRSEIARILSAKDLDLEKAVIGERSVAAKDDNVYWGHLLN